MPKLQELNKNLRAAKKAQKPKAIPVPQENPTEDLAAAVDSGFQELNKAVAELVAQSSDVETTVVVDTKPIAEAVKEGLANIPAPIVNIPPRELVGYQVDVQRNSRGDLSGAFIQPKPIAQIGDSPNGN